MSFGFPETDNRPTHFHGVPMVVESSSQEMTVVSMSLIQGSKKAGKKSGSERKRMIQKGDSSLFSVVIKSYL